VCRRCSPEIFLERRKQLAVGRVEEEKVAATDLLVRYQLKMLWEEFGSLLVPSNPSESRLKTR
jgi:hypothetical protein